MVVMRIGGGNRTQRHDEETYRMARKLALAALGAMLIGGVAGAQELDVIELRQVGMDLQGGTYTGIRAVVASKGDLKSLDKPAQALERWGKDIPMLFPQGTEKGHNTKALSAIWSDNAGFQKAALKLSEEAGKLAVAAKANDADAVAAATKSIGDACAACHKSFRAR
jgi:cytochrome c556